MALVFLGLGSNLGEKQRNLLEAVHWISELGKVLKQSTYYFSKAQGFESENDFVNQVISIETTLSPMQLLVQTQGIERKMGRLKKSTQEYSDRVIDIDILMYDNLKIEHADLLIPHPRINERDFVKIPLKEIYEASTEASAE